MSEMKQPFVYGGFITADKIVAGSITTERIEMGKYYKNVDEWQMAIRKWNNINKDLEIISSPTLEAEYTDFTYGSNAFAEGNVPEVSDLEVREVKYPILFKEKYKPYVVIELIKDLEYGIVDIDECKTIKKIPLDLNEAIDTCKFWNESVRPEHEHTWVKFIREDSDSFVDKVWWECRRCHEKVNYAPTTNDFIPVEKYRGIRSHVHEFKIVSDELGMLHSTCWCGEDQPTSLTITPAKYNDVTWEEMDWIDKALAASIVFGIVAFAGMVCYVVVVLFGKVF